MAVTEIAAFNLERTVTEFIYKQCLLDISSLDIDESEREYSSALSISQQRKRIARWFIDHDTEAQEQLLSQTVALAPKRVATWAVVMMQAQADVGRDLLLYSTRVPYALLDAYADGIEAVLDDATIPLRYAPSIGSNRDKYHVGILSKEVVLRKHVNDGDRIAFVADSYEIDRGAVNMGEYGLFVNMDRRFNTYDLDRVWWPLSSPHVARVVPAHERDDVTFDLRAENDQDDFIDLLARDDPAFE